MRKIFSQFFINILLFEVLLNSSVLYPQKNYEVEKIKSVFNIALTNAFKDSLSKKKNLTDLEINGLSRLILAKEYNNLLSADTKIKLDSLINRYENLIEKNAENFTLEGTNFALKAEILLRRLLDESKIATVDHFSKFRYSPLSDYRFLMGGSWTHSENDSGLSGIFTAEMFVRTRLLDWRDNSKSKIESLNQDNYLDNEMGFFDLLLDAQFITNQPFNSLDSSGNNDVRKFLLKSVRSSSLYIEAFVTPNWLRFFDNGVFGVFSKFEISTKGVSADVFRRLIWGIRLENRSRILINGANIEIGFTENKTPGSLDVNNKFRFFNADRVVINLELPMTDNIKRLGLYVQFHGEWPTFWRKKEETVVINNAIVQGLANPPVYQFRLGATFDPIKLFGPLFGLQNQL